MSAMDRYGVVTLSEMVGSRRLLRSSGERTGHGVPWLADPIKCPEHVENAGILDGVNVAQNRAVVLDSLENNIGSKQPFDHFTSPVYRSVLLSLASRDQYLPSVVI